MEHKTDGIVNVHLGVMYSIIPPLPGISRQSGVSDALFEISKAKAAPKAKTKANPASKFFLRFFMIYFIYVRLIDDLPVSKE